MSTGAGFPIGPESSTGRWSMRQSDYGSGSATAGLARHSSYSSPANARPDLLRRRSGRLGPVIPLRRALGHRNVVLGLVASVIIVASLLLVTGLAVPGFMTEPSESSAL